MSKILKLLRKKVRQKISTISLISLLFSLLIVGTLFVPLENLALANETITVSVSPKTPTNSACESETPNEWHFVINELKKSENNDFFEKPKSINVEWSNKNFSTLNLSEPIESANAHYRTSENLNLSITKATVIINKSWDGNFVLSHSPCQLTDPNEVKIIASKIVCSHEADLPNWGTGGDEITRTTATDYVASHSDCALVPDWNFQWGDKTAVKKPGDFYGEGSSAENWTTFGPTNLNGKAEINVDITNIATNPQQLRLREVLKSEYIPFTYPDNSDNVSAEFYCSDDVLNYDNYDYIRKPIAGTTYYCVAFNTLKPTNEETGTIIIKKVTIPQERKNDEPTEFPFLTSNITDSNDASYEGFSLRDGDENTQELSTATYSVTETSKDGWDLTSAVCSDESDPNSISLQAGETVTCTFTNTLKTPEPVCGNGISESPEVCDDGSNNGTFGFCNSDCTGNTPSICGNETTEFPETCDDGNTNSNDGCSATCTKEEIPSCELELTKTANKASVFPGESLAYQLILKNTGTVNCTGSGVILNDEFDNNILYNSAIPAPTVINSNLLRWNFGTIVLGNTKTVNLTVTVSQNAVCNSTLVNKARVWSEQTGWGPYVEKNISVVCLPPFPPSLKGNLIVQKTTIPAGDSTVFHITTSGTGVITDGGAGIITDALDQNYEVTAGTYAVSETVPIDWIETNNTCQNVVIEAGKTKYCLITNTLKAPEPRCGNEEIEASETCDDGNTNSGDGCSATCQIEEPQPTYQCSDEIDNDSDNLIDEADPGCHIDGDPNNSYSYVPTDDDEYNSLIREGDVVINEIMQNPAFVTDSKGEWLEFFNTTEEDINLEGCVLSDNGSNSHTVIGSLMLLANSYLVMGNNGSFSTNGGVLVDYVYSSTTLGNTDDEIIFTCDDVEIDKVEYDGGPYFPDPTGKSMILSDTLLDNNVGENWCESSSVFGDGDLGTPGSMNDSCSEQPNGIISGYKFNDLNGNKIWDITDDEDDTNDEPGLGQWMINLYKDTVNNLIANTTTLATNLGYYEFKNLDAGTYFVKEVNQNGWDQTLPTNPEYYEITILDDELSENNDFGNHEETIPPIYQCSDGIDNDDDTFTDIDDPTCYRNEEYDPEIDDEQNTPPIITLSSESMTIYVGTSFNAIDYATAEDAEDGDITSNIVLTGSVDPSTPNTYFVNYNVVDAENEPATQKTLTVNVITQECVSNCGGGGGSTVITKPSIIISNEKVVYLGDGKAKVTWTTNIETTEQVVYGDNSLAENSNLGDLPTYGYDSVNEESNFMIINHDVIIDGLTDKIPYFFRPVADRTGSTGEKIGVEVFYEPGEVKGVEAPEPEPEEPCDYLLEYIKLGADNNPIEVKKLETFLNVFEGENLKVNGIYEQVDFDAVSRFQKKYNALVLSPWNHDSSTGYVYITTKKRINEIYCQRDFSLTPNQEAEINNFTSKSESDSVSGGSDTSNNSDHSNNNNTGTETNLTPDDSDTNSNGQVAGAEDETDNGEFSNETEQKDNNSAIGNEINDSGNNDVMLLGDDKEDEQTVQSEDGSIIQSFKNFSIWIWIVILVILGSIVYMFLFTSKNKKNE